MALYKGKKNRVEVPATVIADKFADLSVLEKYMDRIPAEQREQMGDLRFERDAIVIINPSVGEMKFRISERTPQKIVFDADGMVPLKITVNLDEVSENTTDVSANLDIEIPMMLRPMIGGKLQQVADMFGDMIAKLSSTPFDQEG